ncbi:MAG TPA: DMT family transporter [Candidatus Sulfomarinibacteraceae bacterium]|nr:DMT family transporter [Candidatus Sulfomarinibacteraceae bacterium]
MSLSSVALPAADKRRPRSVLLVLLASALWSTSGMFISLIDREGAITPVGIAFWRDLATFVVLFGGISLLRPDLLRIKMRDLPWLALMGSLSIGLFHVLWNSSILVNGVAMATVLQSNAPMVVAVIAWIVWREPLTWRKIVAILLALMGSVFIGGVDSLQQQQIALQGLLLGLGSAVTYGFMSLFGKKLAGDYSSWTILVYIFGFGALTLLPFQIRDGFTAPHTALGVAYFAGMVLITTIGGFALYTLALSRLQASVAAIVATAEVPFAAIVSYVTLGERLDVWQVAGGLLVISGVILLSWPQRRVRVDARRAKRRTGQEQRSSQM